MSKSIKAWWLIFLACGLALLTSVGNAWAQDSVNVAVLNMEGHDIEESLLGTLTSVLRNEAQQHEQYAVVNQAPINLSEILVVLGCNYDTARCLRQAAEHLEARVLIYGKVERRGEGLDITVEVFDASGGQVIHRLVRSVEATDDPVITFRREIEAFFAGQKAVPATRLAVGSNVDGATIKIEDTNVGTTPFERTGLPAGRYHVHVSAPGHEPWESLVELVDGGNMRVWANLVPIKEQANAGAVAEAKPNPTPKVQGGKPTAVPAPPLPRETIGTTNWGAWSAIGVGAVALGGSGLMVMLMRDVEQEIRDKNAAETLTQREYKELVDQGKSYELSHRVLLGVGGAALTAGVLWLVLEHESAPVSSARAPLEVLITPQSVGAAFHW